ncbi:niban-like protein 1 isoform X2 [Rhinatrema bivittatum]|uniref:niban-like protein 1 isoform X2 n=1 Tax=Rhinatrema bivittatum TaxID=194408 RepID=UPI0011260252|nr:niban-like protein 1 isoform X2 [Rhinatrema bivittatum]
MIQEIQARTDNVLREFCKFYEEQYGVALFNKVRYEIEGNGGPQSQLLHRKAPLEDGMIFSGNLFQYLEDNKKWRNRFCIVPRHYCLVLYESKMAYDRGIQPRAGINCAGYKVLTSVDQYVDLLNNSLPGGKGKSSSSQILKCATQFPIILWHPYARHYYFCVMTEKEHVKWTAVFQDSVRHANNGISEDSKVEAPAFTDAVRLYRQSKEQYGTWDMLCGNEVQVLSNLVMEELIPELKNVIGPKLKGKSQDRQRAWMLISDTVYRMVQEQAKVRYDAIVGKCESTRSAMESTIRTDMDQIITSKEHLANKIRASVFSKAEICVRNHIQPYIASILDALMLPTSQGFVEVRDLFFKEVTEMNMNVVNEGGKDKLGEHMEKLSQLAYHPVKMQACYEKMDLLKLEGLQQRFDVSSPAVFKQRAQIYMREQMDNSIYTFEQLLHQELEKSADKEELCKDIQRILERVLKKYDYDSSSVRKKFFREALLQIIIPFLLKKLAPTCKSDLPRFQELIFEDFARFILVENTYEEVVLQSVMKDIMQAVKEAAVQRKHNLFRDSMVLHNSDPSLHLLGDDVPIDWSKEYGNEPVDATSAEKRRRAKQVVSVIHDDDGTLPYESCMEVPAHEDIKEEPEVEQFSARAAQAVPQLLHSPDNVTEIRGMLVKEFQVKAPIPVHDQTDALLTNSTAVEGKASESSKDGEPAVGEGQVPEPVRKMPAVEEGQVPELVRKMPAVEECQVPEPVRKMPAAEECQVPEPVRKMPAVGEGQVPEPVRKMPAAGEGQVPEPVRKMPAAGEGQVPEPVRKMPAAGEGQVPEPVRKMPAAGEGQVPEPVRKMPAAGEGQVPEPVRKMPAAGEGQVLEPVRKMPAAEECQVLEPVRKMPAMEECQVPEPTSVKCPALEPTNEESKVLEIVKENLSTEESKVNEPTHYSKETPSIYLVQSNRDDSGFQSPMSEEGEDLEEKPVPPASPFKPASGDALVFSDKGLHLVDGCKSNKEVGEDAAIHGPSEQAKQVQAPKEPREIQEGQSQF